MLDADPAKLTKIGKVVIDEKGKCRVVIRGLKGDDCSCRDLTALAMLWAIGELQRELMATLEQPGGGDCAVAD